MKPARVGGHRREREVVALGYQQLGDVGPEDLACLDRDLRMNLVQAGQQPRDRVPNRGQGVGEAQRASLPAGCRLHPAGRAVGGGQDAPAVGEENLSFGGQFNAPRGAPQKRDPERPLQCLDLLADRLLGDVQVFGRPGEAMQLRHRREGAQLAQLKARTSHHTRESTSSRPGSDKPRLLSNNKLRLFLRAAPTSF